MMIKLVKYPDKKDWPQIVQRPVKEYASLEKDVKKILQRVKEKGDKALRKYSKELDGVSIKNFRVTEAEIQFAAQRLTEELKQAIQQAKENITLFHQSQKEEGKRIETMPGVTCWRESVAIDKVGLYIPGGSAPLFSTVLMLTIPAQLAGCTEIVLCTPPQKDGSIHPAILYTAQLCGVTSIFKTGGAQAIAAMAFGTESIPKVFKIFGPGNQYVTMAKQWVQQQGIAMDMPAGPSEVLVIADESANPIFVAADLLSQAEHGPDSQVLLLTTSEKLAGEVITEIAQQQKQLSRSTIAEQSLLNSKIILCRDLDMAQELADLYAPEHLILSCVDAAARAKRVRSAGSVFIGHYSPESAGDYASGTNHTLPTNGYAAMYSGVSLDSFVKKITFQELTKEGLINIGNTVMAMAAAEGLDAHQNAIALRLKT